MIYDNDSLFTLSGAQIVGVLAISGLLWASLLAAVWGGNTRGGRMLSACVGFAGFVWLSPQVYYLFYWATFDGLPLQSVIKAPPSPVYLLRLLTFTEETSLSRHGQAVLGWSLLVLACLRKGAA